MQLTYAHHTAGSIRCFSPGTLQIDDTHYTHSLLISDHRPVTAWPVATFATLNADHILLWLQHSNPCDILLLGTGTRPHFLPSDLLHMFYAQQKTVEVMHSAAACRTYNILRADNRHVTAAIIIA